MFLPRKLQKRAHEKGATSTTSLVVPAADATEGGAGPYRSSDYTEAPPTSLREDGDQSESSSSRTTSASSTPAAQPTSTTSTEAAKLERLVDFLFVRLSPLSLALAASEEQNRSGKGPCSELVNNITSSAVSGKQGSKSKSPDSRRQQGSKIHLARLLNLTPGLATRCKSISLLSEALYALQEGPAGAWFRLHGDIFQIEWSATYTEIVQQLHTATTTSAEKGFLPATLAPHLVYIESIPPRIRTRSQAASYVVPLVQDLSDTKAAVLAVLEPGLVDRHLMTGPSSLPTSSLEDKWISGRGFFIVDSPTYVEKLCSKYRWDLAERMSTSQSTTASEKLEPIRCLNWPKWIEMKELYLEQQQRSRQVQNEQRGSSTEQSQDVTDNDALADTDINNGKRKRSSAQILTKNGTDETDGEDDWYRGTILFLPLTPSLQPDASLTLPSYSLKSDLTPAFFNRHLKPQLEKQVPESISYINTLPSHSSESSDTVAAIRTSHPKYAAQLLCHFPELQRMGKDEEAKYWADLPAKVRTAAQNRILALDRKLSPHHHAS